MADSDEKMVYEIDAMKNELLEIVMHELRTPLSTVSGAVSNLQNEVVGPLSKAQKEYVDIAMLEIGRLNRAIKRLLEISGTEKHSGEFHRDRTGPSANSGRIGGKVLVIEDEAVMQRILCDWLTANGYQPISALDGEQGVTRALREKPDLILLDIKLPKMSGFDVARSLKNDEKSRKIPIVIMTANPSEKSVMEGRETGAYDYLIKPFEFDMLKMIIEKNLS